MQQNVSLHRKSSNRVRQPTGSYRRVNSVTNQFSSTDLRIRQTHTMGINIVLPLLLQLVISLFGPCHGEIVPASDKVELGQLRYFYDTGMGAAACQNVILLGWVLA